MTIEDQDFKIEKLKEGEFYNLSFLKVINKDTDKERKEFQVIAYGIPIDVCIRKIVDYRLRDEEGVYTLKEYIEKYKELVDDISNLIEK